MNIFDYLNDSLNKISENIKDNFMDTLEDLKDLIENKLKYGKLENSLEEYFQTEGKEIYEELTNLSMNNNAYFFVTRDDFLQSTIHICNGLTKSCSKAFFTQKNIEPGIIFTINDGKVNIDDKMTQEYINILNSNESKISDTGFLNDIYNSGINNKTYFKIQDSRDEVIKKYAQNTAEKGNLYMIQSKHHDYDNNGIYTVLEFSTNGEDVKYFSVLETELPQGAHLDDMMRYENGKYVLDRESYKNIRSEVTQKANEIIKEQNKELESYRVENNIYYVEDTTPTTAFLVRQGSRKVFEEPKISEEIIQSVSNGHILRYTNGEYVWDLELTEKNLNPDIEFDFDNYKD